MPNNIMITGNPGSGKSTLVENVLKELDKRRIGFFTREVRKDGFRIGFDIVLPSGKTIPLARTDLRSDYRVSKYFVDISNFELVLSELLNIERSDFLYIDEIGQMELFSNKFKELTLKYLDSENTCLATLSSVYSDEFIGEIKNRDDVEFVELSPDNREAVFQRVKAFISKSRWLKKVSRKKRVRGLYQLPYVNGF
jgi:nucleoside-triphosphatase